MPAPSASNLCSHFLEAAFDLRHPHAKQLRLMSGIDANVLEQLARWVEVSQKFFLPHQPFVLGAQANRSCDAQASRSNRALPFPVTVLEYRQPGRPAMAQDALWEVSATKRIVVAVEIPKVGDPDFAKVRGSALAEAIEPAMLAWLDEVGGLLTASIVFDDAEASWSVAMGAMLVPSDADVPRIVDASSCRDWARLSSVIDQGSSTLLSHTCVPVLLEAYAMLAHVHGHDAVQRTIREHSLRELQALLDVLDVLGCSNVGTSPHAPAGLEKLNRRREKSGKPPFFTYRVLSANDGSNDWLQPGRIGAHGEHTTFTQQKVAHAQ